MRIIISLGTIIISNFDKVNISNAMAKNYLPASARVAHSLGNLCKCSYIQSLTIHGYGRDCIVRLFQEWGSTDANINNLDVGHNKLENRGSLYSLFGFFFYDFLFFFLINLGLEALACFLMENKCIKQLKIDHNDVSYNGWNAIYNALFVNFTLEKIKQ